MSNCCCAHACLEDMARAAARTIESFGCSKPSERYAIWTNQERFTTRKTCRSESRRHRGTSLWIESGKNVTHDNLQRVVINFCRLASKPIGTREKTEKNCNHYNKIKDEAHFLEFFPFATPETGELDNQSTRLEVANLVSNRLGRGETVNNSLRVPRVVPSPKNMVQGRIRNLERQQTAMLSCQSVSCGAVCKDKKRR